MRHSGRSGMTGGWCSWGILGEGPRARRQLYPRVSTAVVDGDPGCGKGRVGKSTHGHAYGFVVAVFGAKDVRAADRAEPEYEPGPLIADTNVFGGGSKDFEWSWEAGQRREHAASSALAGETVANANSFWVAFDFNAQLPAGTRGCSGRHRAPRFDCYAVKLRAISDHINASSRPTNKN
jgi:hypothetical protein